MRALAQLCEFYGILNTYLSFWRGESLLGKLSGLIFIRGSSCALIGHPSQHMAYMRSKPVNV